MTSRLTFTFRNLQGKLRTVTLTGEGLPGYVRGDLAGGKIGFLRMLVDTTPIHISGPVDVPDESEVAQ